MWNSFLTTFDEQRFIQLTRDGDYDAFNRLVVEYQSAVFAVVLRMVRNRAAAEDITQDTFISAFRKISSYRGGIFRAWLFRIAKNASLVDRGDAVARVESELSQDFFFGVVTSLESEYVSHVTVSIDQPRNDRLAADIDTLGTFRDVDELCAAHGLDTPRPNEHDAVLDGCCAGPVDDSGTDKNRSGLAVVRTAARNG